MSLSISIFCYHVLPLHHNLEANIVIFIHFLYLLQLLVTLQTQPKNRINKKIDPSYCQ